jgi:hypothetical protein
MKPRFMAVSYENLSPVIDFYPSMSEAAASWGCGAKMAHSLDHFHPHGRHEVMSISS